MYVTFANITDIHVTFAKVNVTNRDKGIMNK